MSIEANKWAWQQQVGPSEKLVLLAIAEHAHKDGTNAYPSVERIADMTGAGRRTVFRALAGLRRRGLVKVGKRQLGERAFNVYTLPILDQVSNWHPIGVTVAPKPSENHQIKIKRKPISEDWKMSESNYRLAASLGIRIRGPGWSVEDEFRDWALMYGHKSTDWQAACSTFLKNYETHEKEYRRIFDSVYCQ